jgi:hypothetical protein
MRVALPPSVSDHWYVHIPVPAGTYRFLPGTAAGLTAASIFGPGTMSGVGAAGPGAGRVPWRSLCTPSSASVTGRCANAVTMSIGFGRSATGAAWEPSAAAVPISSMATIRSA